MSDYGFAERLLDRTDWFYKVALHQFDWWKKIQGTRVLVNRVDDSDEYKDLFGTIYKSTLTDDRNVIAFEYVVLITMNQMMKIYQKSIDSLMFPDNKDVLQLGDVLIFSRKGQEFKYVITDIQSHGEAQNVLNQYTIQGMTEVGRINK